MIYAHCTRQSNDENQSWSPRRLRSRISRTRREQTSLERNVFRWRYNTYCERVSHTMVFERKRLQLFEISFCLQRLEVGFILFLYNFEIWIIFFWSINENNSKISKSFFFFNSIKHDIIKDIFAQRHYDMIYYPSVWSIKRKWSKVTNYAFRC